MRPASSAKELCDLRLNHAVTDWVEYGDYASLSDAFVIACDGSGADVTTDRLPGQESLPVTGAAVDPDGRWWGWRASVRAKITNRSSSWAESITLLLTARIAPAGGVIYCDHESSIALARYLATGKAQSKRGGSAWKYGATFGPLPMLFPCDFPDVQYCSNMFLHARAHALANRIRFGASRQSPSGSVWDIEQHCAAVASGWSASDLGGAQHWEATHRYHADQRRWFSDDE